MTVQRSRAVLLAVLGLVTFTGIGLGRAVESSRAELETARTHHREGRLARATEHYRRSLRWSFPFSPFRDDAASGLRSIATGLEKAGDRTGALLAWRSLVGGVAASRFMYSGEDPAAEQAKDEIARILALQGGAPIDANLAADKLEADHRRLLAKEASPHPVWATILLFGFAVWIGSLLLMIERGFDRSGRVLWPAARAPLSSAVVGLVSFLVGMLLA